ncbi:MAG: SPOR domain-containing protein [Gammaproteobacteria bacterium]
MSDTQLMGTELQQRIIGAIVLVALGVIFIPALLDGSGYRSREARTIEIPAPPEFPPLSQTRLEPIPTPVDAKIKQVEKQQQQQAQEPVQAWALQAGTFSSKANADKFAAGLKKYGHAYVDDIIMDGKKVYRVRIGPELDKERLQVVSDKLNKDRKIKSFITTHP